MSNDMRFRVHARLLHEGIGGIEMSRELAEARKTDCRTCKRFDNIVGDCNFGREFCVGGNNHVPTHPPAIVREASQMNTSEPRFSIREHFKLIPRHNPISGYRWHEHGPTTSYSVVGPCGPISWHRTERGALKALEASK